MKTRTATGIAILLLALAAPSPASASRFAKKTKVTEKARVKKGARGKTTGPAKTRRGPGAGKRLMSRLFSRRGRKSAKPASRQALEASLANKYLPYQKGVSRTWSVSMNGKPLSTMTETVVKTEIVGTGELHSQVRTTFDSTTKEMREAGVHSRTASTAVHVTKNGELQAPQSTVLGKPAPAGVTQSGPALPAKLKRGQAWLHTTHDGPGITRAVEYRVTRAIRMKGPDGKMRKGFEVSVVDRSRVTAGKVVVKTSTIGSYKVLEGVGMVHSKMTTNGNTMVHQLTDFSAPTAADYRSGGLDLLPIRGPVQGHEHRGNGDR